MLNSDIYRILLTKKHQRFEGIGNCVNLGSWSAISLHCKHAEVGKWYPCSKFFHIPIDVKGSHSIQQIYFGLYCPFIIVTCKDFLCDPIKSYYTWLQLSYTHVQMQSEKYQRAEYSVTVL